MSSVCGQVSALPGGSAAALLVADVVAHGRREVGLVRRLAEVERSGEWALGGAVSLVGWLRAECLMSGVEAARWVRRARLLGEVPLIADAVELGVLSLGHVVAVESVVTAVLMPVLVAQQELLVRVLAPLSVAEAVVACRVWRSYAEAVVDEVEPSEPRRLLWFRRVGAELVGSFRLDEAAGVEFERAIGQAVSWEGVVDGRSGARVSADALFDVCAFFNKNHAGEGTPRNVPHVEVHVDVAELESRRPLGRVDGSVVDHALVDSLLCDCVVHRVMRQGDAVLGFGRSVRSVPRDLFRAVAARDGGCRFPNCDRGVRLCDAHHIRFWRHMGLTELDNLVLLCSRHHHLLHRRHLELKLGPDAVVCVTWPDGRCLTSEPRARPPTAAPFAAGP